MFENRLLRRAFRPKRDEVRGEWRKLLNEVLSDLYCSPNIVWVIRSMRWVGHVARMGGRGEVKQGFSGERDHLEDPGTDGKIILIWIFERWEGGQGLD